MRHEPRIERGKAIEVTHTYRKNGDERQPIFKDETREFSLNYFTRSRRKVNA